MASTPNQSDVNKDANSRPTRAVGTIAQAKNFFMVASLAENVFIKKEEQIIVDTSEFSDNFVLYYLYCHASELALKSFLMIKGFSDNKLKGIGHDLEKTLETAKEHGLDDAVSLSAEETEAISSLGWYYKLKAFEYLITGCYSIPCLRYVRSASRSLTHGLKPYIRKEVLKIIKTHEPN